MSQNGFKDLTDTESLSSVDLTAIRRRIADLEKLENEQQRTQKVQKALYRIAEASISSTGIEELFVTLHRIVSELMYARNFYISFYDADHERISWPYFVDEFDRAPGPRELKKGLTEYVLFSGKSILVSNEGYQAMVIKGRIEAILEAPEYWLGVPLKDQAKAFGVLAVQSYNKNIGYTEEDKELLTFVSHHIAVALLRKQAEEALQESRVKLEHLSSQMDQFSRAAMSIMFINDQQIIFDKISSAIVEYSDYGRVIISMFKNTYPYREILGFGGVDEETVDTLRKVEMSKEWYNDVLIKGERIGPLSYYIPHTMKYILNQRATVYGEGAGTGNEDAWHPEDNLFVIMNNKKGELIGVISVDDSKSGSRPTEETVRPLEIFSGLISQIILLNKEEEERQKLETQLIQAHKMESIGILAGGIAHDFNNILSIILGNAEMAMEDTPNWNPVHENIEEIRTATLRARDIVTRLLSFSRESELEKQRLDLAPVIAQALKVVQVSFSSRIKVQTRISKNYPMVLADPSQIHEMIVNLCANAGEAMSETGGILKVILSSTGIDPGSGQQFKDLTPGEYLEMIISDTGSGIDPEIREKIFDPYFTTKEFGKGTGMGLSVVHGIVKTHGGAIAVDCTAGQDTCFRVLLPAAGEDGKQT